VLPPPPWAGADAGSLRPLPVAAKRRTDRQRARLRTIAVLVALVAAAVGYFGVRLVAHLESGIPVAAGTTAHPAATMKNLTSTEVRPSVGSH
jgi:eukaryotic-like serine/threonine-protein kinase